MAERLFKVLQPDGRCYHGGTGRWRLPTRQADGTWLPGAWMPRIRGRLVPCERGYHLVTLEQLPRWLGPAIWEAEYDGPCLREADKLVVSRARLLWPVETWNDRTARLFAADCAEHVLSYYEQYYPEDMRPRQAVATVRRSAEGAATEEELSAAARAAWDAYDGTLATWTANPSAAAAAARAAAAAAAKVAEKYSITVAAEAAEGAAYAASKVSSRAAERRWQAARLAAYLFGDAGRE